MSLVEEHRTPDGLLLFVVERADDGDLSLGFDGSSPHTHGDILAALSGLPIEAAVRQYIDALLSGQSVIAVSRVGGVVREAWVADPPYEADQYTPPEETIEFRRWDGSAVA